MIQLYIHIDIAESYMHDYIYIYVYIFIFRFFPVTGYHKILIIVPCAIQ